MLTETENLGDLVLVTGASGFIASHIVKLLLEQGYRVRGTVRSLNDKKKVEPLRRLVPELNHKLELVEADLLQEKCWLDAVKDCQYVIHTASPFPVEVPNDENLLIKPAVNGTNFVLNACVQEGTQVKRVVLTSSVAAIYGNRYVQDYKYNEKDWPHDQNLFPYSKSKYLAEKAAWDFVQQREKNNLPCFELAVINPGYVMGPLLHDIPCSSTEAISALMNRVTPLIPDVYFVICDVRDTALAHVKAMTLPEAKNNRHIIASREAMLSFKELASILKTEFPNYDIPSTMAPNFLLKLAAVFSRTVRQVKDNLSLSAWFDNSRLINVLDVHPHEVRDTVVDMANSLIEKKIVHKK